MDNAFTPDWYIVGVAISLFSLTGFVVIGILWLRKLREAVGQALAETTAQQLRTSQRLNQEIENLRQRQVIYDQQIQTLAQAGLRLQQEIVNVATKIDASAAAQSSQPPTIH